MGQKKRRMGNYPSPQADGWRRGTEVVRLQSRAGTSDWCAGSKILISCDKIKEIDPNMKCSSSVMENGVAA